MDRSTIKGIVEGLLFVSGDEGISIQQISKVTEVDGEIIKGLIAELALDYEANERGFHIIQSNKFYHLTTKKEHSSYYKKLNETPSHGRMSQALLETLAIIAYKQPITRTEIEDIRGVNSDYAVQTLIARSFIEVVGEKPTIGRPKLLATTAEFLIYFGLSSLADLPPLLAQLDDEQLLAETDLFFQQLDE